MFEIKITDRDLLSHLYLSDLVCQQGLRDFALSKNTLCSAKTLAGAQKSNSNSESISFTGHPNLSKLVVFTEGLHLQQLTQVTQALCLF